MRQLSKENPDKKVIVIGNEKGGAGKTTTSIHIIMSLLHQGFNVASIDLDVRQRSLSSFLQNRKEYITKNNIDLPFPTHMIFSQPDNTERDEDLDNFFSDYLSKAMEEKDIVVIDTPGSDSKLSRIAHTYADLVITPINDSFIDLDVLAKVDYDTLQIGQSGIYSEIIWQSKMKKVQRNKGQIEWVVMRNRLSSIDAHNKRKMTKAMERLSQRLGCRIIDGFKERVIYRELFLKGLTLLDVLDEGAGVNVNVSHVAARQELRKVISFLNLKKTAKEPPSRKENPISKILSRTAA